MSQFLKSRKSRYKASAVGNIPNRPGIAVYATQEQIVQAQNAKQGAPVERLEQGDNWLNKQIARDTGTDWDKRGFHMQDPAIVKLRIAAGTYAFYDPSGSMTNKTGQGRVTVGR